MARLEEIQCRLMDVGSHVATPREGSGSTGDKLVRTQLDEKWVNVLEVGGWV